MLTIFLQMAVILQLMVVVLCFSVSTSAPGSSQKKDALLELLENLLDKRDQVEMDNPDDLDLLESLLDKRDDVEIDKSGELELMENLLDQPDDLQIGKRGSKNVFKILWDSPMHAMRQNRTLL